MTSHNVRILPLKSETLKTILSLFRGLSVKRLISHEGK